MKTDDMSDNELTVMEEEMDWLAIDEANARAVQNAVLEAYIDALYARSTALSSAKAKEFIL